MTSTTPLPGWYTDSTNPALVRWWDGAAWTEHVRPHPGAAGNHAQQAQQAQHPVGLLGAGPLFEVRELVLVEQAPAGNAASYRYVDRHGNEIGSLHQTDEHGRTGMRLPGRASQDTMYFRLFDAAGALLAAITQPYQKASEIFKPRITVTDARGRPVGEIKAETAGLGRNRMSFSVHGNRAGGLAATSWLSSKYTVVDDAKHQVAEIVKREFSDFPLPDIPANGDSYWLSRPSRLPEPLGTLVLLAPFALDNAYHSDTK
ncbi:DUF2510 domain-containing protein [Thermocrispum sp.]|jgi:hypothetical protein|uniref:DUF2510 domain-containing protein n=1 Tax=Thermocrispum sp. TaxID=2060768 RepID=UPI00257C76DF|nr:DUF2510 domain-containing protein [Thermocrispum sp.]